MKKLGQLLAAALIAAGCVNAGPVFSEDATIKLWSRADRSGPLRAGNIVAAAD